MNSRKRFEYVMTHRQPDRVAIDMGGTCLTGMRPQCADRLREVLGFPALSDARGIDENIMKWAGADFRAVGDICDLPPFSRQISETERVSCWGFGKRLCSGEWQTVVHPLRDASRDDLKSYPWPEPRIDEKQLLQWEKQAKSLKRRNEHVVVANHPVFGILELGCWLCGYDDFLAKMAFDPDFVKDFFEIVLKIQIKVGETYYTALRPYVDLTTSGDDFGMQQSPLISPEMFAGLVAPYFSERIRQAKKHAHCYYWHHSCGSIFKLLRQIIGCGVDIINPVQTSAAQMEPRLLKKTFGDAVVFWGAMDVQQFLPRASACETAAHARALVDILGRDGGYVMAPAHQIQDDVPAENIIAWIEAVRDYKFRAKAYDENSP